MAAVSAGKATSRSLLVAMDDDEDVHRSLSNDLLMHLTHGQVRKRDPPLRELKLSGPHFELDSLEGIENIGYDRNRDRQQMRRMDVSGNNLDSLKQLCLYFDQLKKIDASGNDLKFLCGRRATENEWPNKMKHLVDLNLAHNQMMQVPSLIQMSHLRVLNLSNNSLSAATFRKLSEAPKLTHLDVRFFLLPLYD